MQLLGFDIDVFDVFKKNCNFHRIVHEDLPSLKNLLLNHTFKSKAEIWSMHVQPDSKVVLKSPKKIL
jgi:hypothetical protein